MAEGLRSDDAQMQDEDKSRLNRYYRNSCVYICYDQQIEDTTILFFCLGEMGDFAWRNRSAGPYLSTFLQSVHVTLYISSVEDGQT